VAYNGTSSELSDVTSGVVQGSAFGPSAFTIFINDLCKVIRHAKGALFADDFKFVGDVSMEDGRQLMHADLDAVVEWSDRNKLPISIDKTVVLHYGIGNLMIQYMIHSVLVKSVTSCKDLGVLRTSNFSYEEHVCNVALKATRLAGMTLKLFCTRDALFLKRVFTTYIRPCLEYAACVWSPLSVSGYMLENVQRRYTKRIRGFADLSYDKRIEKLQLDTLATRRYMGDVILIYKIIHMLVPASLISVGLQLSSAPTRSAGLKLKHFRPRTKLLSANYKYRATKEWNSLPNGVLTCLSLRSFKTALIKYFAMINAIKP
jgi:hypothetical protein